jgi:hypothetical protein
MARISPGNPREKRAIGTSVLLPDYWTVLRVRAGTLYRKAWTSMTPG